jgi:glyoxylase I family protein
MVFRHALLSLLVIMTPGHTKAQSPSSFEYVPSFAAVVVNNMETSTQWYKAVFKLYVKDEIADDKNGYKITILESERFLVELLELKGSVAPMTLLEDEPKETKIQGYFKIGFKVPDMDKCLQHLAELKIQVPRIWTDSDTRKRNFIITDPDGNLIQFFE